ncbi:DGQHR domain protein [Anaeromyxobacter dehalogenans 2CP-1]|uniref:DGQHR domain protein n=1 Tax=Anaeromyxobacter dehalogenans (strain ATCC BAA-258 / DSM 21875 / 2CP-1) TaxID=455488 RepID=B8J8P2_ANAD2|nr:DGQHR domain-containing protein [Anaeromyxobacter dehalogenans]ACL67328.1 DGQHR domain protein [Anaeromyxobacter dehalogenans 2CP-1]
MTVLTNTPEGSIRFEFPAIPVRQPIGQFFAGVMPSERLCKIAHFDVRRMLKERDVETYLGIQRPLNPQRVSELQAYVKTFDACFPTSVILAVDARSAEYDPSRSVLTLKNDPEPGNGLEPIYYRNIARVLDGQHRIAGLMDYQGPPFDVNVSVFVDIDVEDQAYIFSTVNLAQTKVNKSLAYDLAELSKARSPQRTCHNIAVALDQTPKSPFFRKIKRLGTATPGRVGERLTQATFVESLMSFISGDPMGDRDRLLRGVDPNPPDDLQRVEYPFRLLFLQQRDVVIGEIVMKFFDAVRSRWPAAWDSDERGAILNRTNGFRAMMRVLKKLYPRLGANSPVPEFAHALARVQLNDSDFTSERFKPGGGGEVDLYKAVARYMEL